MRKPTFKLPGRGAGGLRTDFLPSHSSVRERIAALTEAAHQGQGGSKKVRAPKQEYIGQVEITVDPRENPTTICFDLQEKIREENWPEWEEIIALVKGIASAERVDDLQVVLTVGRFFRQPNKARKVAEAAASALLLKRSGTIKVLKPTKDS